MIGFSEIIVWWGNQRDVLVLRAVLKNSQKIYDDIKSVHHPDHSMLDIYSYDIDFLLRDGRDI